MHHMAVLNIKMASKVHDERWARVRLVNKSIHHCGHLVKTSVGWVDTAHMIVKPARCKWVTAFFSPLFWPNILYTNQQISVLKLTIKGNFKIRMTIVLELIVVFLFC